MSQQLQTAVIVVLGVVIGAGLIWSHAQHHHTDDAVITAAGGHLLLYSSSHEGLAFEYPDTATTTFKHDGPEDDDWHVLSVIDKQVLAGATSTNIDSNGEGPAAIVIIGAFDQPGNMSLADWVKTSPHANFNLSPDKTLASTTVGGESALAYSYDGLYRTDAVAVAHEGGIYIFTVEWMNAADPIRTDFQNLLKTVHFIP